MQYESARGANVLPMRYVPYNGPDAVPDWLVAAPDRPRVCLSWGHTTPDWEGKAILDFIRRTIDAVLELDAELVLALSPTMRDLLGELPGEVRSAVSAPIHALLATSSAVIHHAGPGTTMTAAAGGVPQLAITNHPHNGAIAARMAATGAGSHLLLHEAAADIGAVKDAVAMLLGKPSHQEAAGRLRQEIADQPSPLTVAEQLAHLR
jgi:UDP:flavonoid glycosyltransferase YjiC (YdhE family)